jgi:hypothetical protein
MEAQRTAVIAGPEWIVAQMPPGYQTRYAEIQRLSAELSGMDRMGRLLWESGPALRETVREAFTSMKFEVDDTAAPSLAMKIDGKRRLLVYVAESGETLEKRSPELAGVFKVVHEVAGSDDRVVFAVNPNGLLPPASRPDPMTTDASTLLTRMGVNIMPTAALFSAWTLSLTDAPRARGWVERLHEQDGTIVRPPSA